MKFVCATSEQMSVDGNVWFEDPENVSIVLDYGEFLADIKILRLLRLFRTAAVYEAMRGDDMILVKVAHIGFEEDLKRESQLLAGLINAGDNGIPRLQSAYRGGNIKNNPYGKTVFRDETRYFIVLEYIEGEFLRDMLHNNPQPWYQHAAWILISVAKTVDYLHRTAQPHAPQHQPGCDSDRLLREQGRAGGAARHPARYGADAVAG